MAGRQKKRESSNRNEALAMTPDRVITECVSTVSDLIQRQMEQFLQSSKKSNVSPRSSSHDNEVLETIPCQVKSSIRSLSEDTRSVFQSVTSLVEERAATHDQKSPCHSRKKVKKTETHVDNLKQHLGSLRTRLSAVDQGKDNSEDMVEKRFQETQKSISGKSAHKSNGKQQSTSNNQQEGSILDQKISSTYKAAQDLGASAGKTDSLKSLSLVLAELDALLAYIERGNDKSEQSESKQLNEKRGELLMSSGSDIGNKGDDLPLKTSSSSSVKARLSPRSANSREWNLSGVCDRKSHRQTDKISPGKTGQSPVVKCTDTRSENLKERERRSPRPRGKTSDSIIPSNTAEIPKTTHHGKVKTKKEHHDGTAFQAEKLSLPTNAETGGCDKNVEPFGKSGSSCPGKEQSNKATDTPSPPFQSSICSKCSNSAATESPQTNGDLDSLDSHHSSLLSNKSKSDTGTSFHLDQKKKPDEESTGGDMLQLNRRASVTDLHVCLETAGEPHLSTAELDMMPTITTSCPDISWSPRAAVKNWSNCLKSLNFAQFSEPRHIKMATVLALVWVCIFIMAICSMSTDISHAPFDEYFSTFNGFVERSLDVWYATEPWF